MYSARRRAHDHRRDDASDDCQLAEASRINVAVIPNQGRARGGAGDGVGQHMAPQERASLTFRGEETEVSKDVVAPKKNRKRERT